MVKKKSYTLDVEIPVRSHEFLRLMHCGNGFVI